MSLRKPRRNNNSYTTRNKVKLVRGGKEFFDLLLFMIGEAERDIHQEFYIFEDDETGNRVMEALKAAAHRGVAVFLHIDAYASQALSNRSIRDMQEAGIRVKKFEPLLRSKHFYFGRRLHHKVVVCDGIYSLVSGRNVSDRYNDMPGEPGWLDMAIYCEGEASLTLLQVCRQLWRGLKTLPQIPQDLLEGFYEQIPTSEHTAVRVRQNDWVKRKNQIHNSYVEMFNKAEKQITIMCSYFLPHEVYRRKMSRAVKRGVKIRVILAGVSDIPIAKHAERYLYDWMLKKKIGIFEYQPTILHAKTAVYDGKWVTIGSYNLNNMSAHVSLELNLDVNDKKFAREVEKELDQIISRHCKEITYENYSQSTGFFRRLWQRVCFVMIKYSLKIFTFYFRQEE